jgi:aspartyl aminopeptidase
VSDVHPATERLVDFLDISPTPFHAVAEVARQLESKGYQRIELAEERDVLPVGTKAYVADGGSLFAFRIGRAPLVDGGWRIIAAHTDSPNLRLKPQPLVRSHGYIRLGLEVYGGVQVPTWVDRDLGMAGLVHLRDPSAPDGMRSELVCIREPLCRIPTLAIHLNRTVNDDGLKLNKQTHLPAVFTLEGDDEDPLRSLIASELEVQATDILTWDLQLFDLQRPALAGARQEFVHSARLDNLASSHAGLEALLATDDDEPGEATAVLALFDHEEIGSQTARGANSRALDNVLRLTLRGSERQGSGSFSRALANSWLVSADMAHAVHPAFADKHDKEHMPRINAGPVIKQNANQRYSTEGETSARWMLICERAEVPVQWYVHRTDLRCGSTVGPMLAARLGVRSIDIGNAMLSMHSIREQCGAEDHPMMIRAMAEFFRS